MSPQTGRELGDQHGRRVYFNQQLTSRRHFYFFCQFLGAFKTLTVVIWRGYNMKFLCGIWTNCFCAALWCTEVMVTLSSWAGQPRSAGEQELNPSNVVGCSGMAPEHNPKNSTPVIVVFHKNHSCHPISLYMFNIFTS